MIGRDGVAGLFCLAGSLVLLAATRGLPQPALVPIGPGFYPRILFATTALFAALLVVADLARRRKVAPRRRPSARYRLVALAFAIFAAYVVLLAPLGYRLATFLFVGGLATALEPPRSARRWALVLAVALVTTLATYWVFEVRLSVLLPRGRLTGF